MDLFSEVALTRDLPEQRLCRGDVATVVEKLPATEAVLFVSHNPPELLLHRVRLD